MGDKLTTHYEYDLDKNLTRQWTKMKGEVEEGKRVRFGIPAMDKDNMTLLADYRYGYDGNGNRTSKESLAGKTSYQYDSLNRLVKVQYPKGLEEFSYDRADNRIRRLTEKEEELYKYDVCNRLVEKQTRRLPDSRAGAFSSPGNGLNPDNAGTAAPQRTKEMEARTQTAISRPADTTNTKADNIIPFRTSTFQYDRQGNLLREERKTEGNRQESIYSYDGFNRQKKIVNFESKVQVNHYDGEGLRHEMEENGKLVKFLYNDREAVVEEKEDGNTIRYIRGYDLVASDSESARTYYHYASDEQGSITHVLGEGEDGSYGLRNYYEYGAFGDFREREEEVENRFGYNGEIFDPIGGQYYLRARYYNPVIGRFTQEDTYYGDGLNLYAYCANLPVGYEDPSGNVCKRKYDNYKKLKKLGLTAAQDQDFMKRAKNASNDAVKSALGEEFMHIVMKQNGYEQLPSKVRGNNGIDGIYVKRNSRGEIIDLVIGEAKFGKSKLKRHTSMGPQMSDSWIKANINNIIKYGNPSVGYELKNYLTKGTYKAVVFNLKQSGYSSVKYRKKGTANYKYY